MPRLSAPARTGCRCAPRPADPVPSNRVHVDPGSLPNRGSGEGWAAGVFTWDMQRFEFTSDMQRFEGAVGKVLQIKVTLWRIECNSNELLYATDIVDGSQMSALVTRAATSRAS